MPTTAQQIQAALTARRSTHRGAQAYVTAKLLVNNVGVNKGRTALLTAGTLVKVWAIRIGDSEQCKFTTPAGVFISNGSLVKGFYTGTICPSVLPEELELISQEGN